MATERPNEKVAKNPYKKGAKKTRVSMIGEAKAMAPQVEQAIDSCEKTLEACLVLLEILPMLPIPRARIPTEQEKLSTLLTSLLAMEV